MGKIYRALYTRCMNGINFASSLNSRDGQKLFSTGGDMGLSNQVLSLIESEIGRDVYNSGMRSYNGEVCRFFSCGETSVLIHYRWMPQEETESREFGITKALIGTFENHPIEYLSYSLFNGNDFFFDYRDAQKKEIVEYKQLLSFQGKTPPPLFKPMSSKTLFGLKNSYPVMSLENAGSYILQSKKILRQLSAAVCHLVKQFALPDEERCGIIIRGTSEQIRYWFAAIGYAFSARSAKNISFCIGFPVSYSYSFSTAALVGWDVSDPDLAKLGDSKPTNLVFLEKLPTADKEHYYDSIAKFDETHRFLIEEYMPKRNAETDRIDNYPSMYLDCIKRYERILQEKKEEEAARRKRAQDAFNSVCNMMDKAKMSVEYRKAIDSFAVIKSSYQDINAQIEIKITECEKKEQDLRKYEHGCKEMNNAKKPEDYRKAIMLFELINSKYQSIINLIENKIVECKHKEAEVIRRNSVQDSFDNACKIMEAAQNPDDYQKAIVAFTEISSDFQDINKQIKISIAECKQKGMEMAHRKSVQDAFDNACKIMDAAQCPEDYRRTITEFGSIKSNYQDINDQIRSKVAMCVQKEADGINNATREETIKYPDGGHYQGFVYNGTPHSWGTMTWPNGNMYTGMWHFNSMQGYGAFNHANGMWEMGERSNIGLNKGFLHMYNQALNEEPTSVGCTTVQHIPFNGQFIATLYVGDFKDSYVNGWGAIRFPNGWYTGQFDKGLPNGWGVYRYRDDNIIVSGVWKNGMCTEIKYQGKHEFEKGEHQWKQG